VARRDRGRKNYILENFREDINDPLHYDLILNTDHLADADAAGIIIRALVSRFVRLEAKAHRNGAGPLVSRQRVSAKAA
jgi:cytidylate kinase